MRKHLLALLIAPTLIPVQVVFAQNSQPSLNQKLGMYSKPSVVRIKAACWGRYTYKGKSYTSITGTLGSGYFVNPNGYIVTNAYVVKEVKDGEEKCKENISTKLVEQIKEYYRFQTNEVDKDIQKRIKNSLDKNPEDFAFYRDVLMPNTKESFPFETKESGSAKGSQDVAIIKIETKNAPVLQLGDSDTVQLLDNVLVIGYPSAADQIASELTTQSRYEASVTEGKVSNTKKKLQNNAPVLQIDMPSASGITGSPVLNNQGQVIGMIVFVGEAYRGGTIPFAIPTSTIQEFIRRSGTVNEQGVIDRRYREGLELYWKQDYRGAKAHFEAVKGLFPQHSEIDQLIRDSEQKIADSWDKTDYSLLRVVAISGLIVVMAGVFLFVFFSRRNRSSSIEFEPEVAYNPVGVPDVEQKPEPQQERQPLQVIPNRASNILHPTTVISTQSYIELKNLQGDVRKLYLQKEKYQIGRDRKWSDIDIPDTGWEVLSRHHAVIKKEGQNYRIYDGDGTNPSTNRIRINGIPIDSQAGHLLEDGDQLKIGLDPSNQVTLIYVEPANRESVVA
jgi:S1-C subfamily serine protease/pSer/pThr/pTyr-binding forkhead associated (FHA) protein